MSDVSAFAETLDFIEIMDYDVWSIWSPTAGPNAPLNDSCAPNGDQVGSAVSAIEAWNAAGMPRSQIVLAVAAYGHSFAVTPDAAFVNSSTTELAGYPPFNAKKQPVGDKWDGGPGLDVCGILDPQGGVFNFFGMMDEGYLDDKGNAAPHIAYRYDECSQTVSN